MTLHLATLLALGVANLAVGGRSTWTYGPHGSVFALNIGSAEIGIIVGDFTRDRAQTRTFCRFELVVVEGCVIRAKGCHLQGQAPLCPEGQWN